MQRRTASGDFDTSDHAVTSARLVPVSLGDQPVIQQLYRQYPSLGPAEPPSNHCTQQFVKYNEDLTECSEKNYNYAPGWSPFNHPVPGDTTSDQTRD